MPKYEFVAVDFDGTLCTNAFPEIGEPLDEAVAFCKAQEIPIHAVNENPWNPYAATIGLKPSDGRKVYADLYIDDKAINPVDIERIVHFGAWEEAT